MHNNQSLLLGVFYALHARKPQNVRSEYYKCLHAAWLSHSQALPGAIRILAGDTNLPELQYDDEGNMTPTDSISRFWCEQLMPGMLCANCHSGKPQATHRKGNTLDLIFYSPEISREQCTIGKLMGTDHHPVQAKFRWGYNDNKQTARWKPAKQVTQQQFDADMSAPLAALHSWARHHIQDNKQQIPLARLTNQFAILMGAIIKGITWRNNSPYGRFTHQSQQQYSTPWWNSQCRNALHQVRTRRGKANHKSARLHLKRSIAKAKRDYWQAEVATIERKAKTSIILSPQIHKRIQNSIKSKLKASHIIKVKGETLSKQEAIKVWTGYLAAQVSWQGPKTPEQILISLR